MNRLRFVSAVAPALVSLCAGGTSASEAAALIFEGHGAYFSHRLQITPPLDPQVFVADASVSVGGIGLENIEHVAGLRALRLDERNVQLFSAEGAGLGFTSTKWLEGSGGGSIVDLDDGTQRVTVEFEQLIVFGVYSLFKQMTGASGSLFVPVDGRGRTNSFKADAAGRARLTVISPQPIKPDGTILLTYHSDGKAHGLDRGSIGLRAHDHLIAPIRSAGAA